MTPFWLVMLGGLLGSSHCVGMCGGFAALVGLHTGSLVGNLRAQLVYSTGRLLSYATLGGVAGFAGQRLISSLPHVINVPAVLSLIAGLFLVREGVMASGLMRRRVGGESAAGCLFGPLFSALMRMPGARNTFVAGVATGLLPCGLVYAFVSLAASSGDLLHGATIMLAFGGGTVPLMVVTGCGASLVSWAARRWLWQIAAWSVMMTGLLTVGRGIAYLHTPDEQRAAACPFCVSNSSEATHGSSASATAVGFKKP